MRGSEIPAKYPQGSGPSSRISHSKSLTVCAATMAACACKRAWRLKVGVMMETAGAMSPLVVHRLTGQAFGDKAADGIGAGAIGARRDVPHPHLAPVIGLADVLD